MGNFLPVVAGAKLLLAAARPMQILLDRPGTTHDFCNQQAVKILRTDGFTGCAAFFEKYLAELNAGVQWADKGWKNIGHYFEPATNKGLWHFANATEDFHYYYNAALAGMRRKDYAKAVFFLGAAIHLIQDLCVPHHARAKLFCGHQEYEEWARCNYLQYAINDQGLYNEGISAHAWLLSNAIIAADLFDMVDGIQNSTIYDRVTAILLPRAQRSTAGFLQQFFIATREEINCLTITPDINMKIIVA